MNPATVRLASLPAMASALGLALCAAFSSPTRSDSGPQPAPRRAAPTRSQYQGAASCSVVGCHGSSESRAGDASAYRIWLTRDPHARAFAVLHNERSQRIAANLAGPTRNPTPPFEDARCLNCHVHPDADASRHAPGVVFEDGVSCESCHGPAERWVEEHWSIWKTRPVSTEAREALGMVPTKDLLVRAKLCAGCHVGGPTRDVNHDLIAAGHPRLNFEYSAFLANMPKHWDTAKDKAGDPEQETRAWAIGQLASAQAALDLLAWRAGRSDQQASEPAPWPEFAEYSCFSCHHDLSEPGWSKTSEERSEIVGRLRWGPWYFALAPRLARSGSAEVASPFASLDQEMSQPEPRPKEVERLARLAGERCREALGRLGRAGGVTPDVIRGLLEAHAGDQPLGWDAAAQLYLAAAARTEAATKQGAGVNREERVALGVIVESLRFRPSYDSPKGWNQGTPQAFRSALQRYLKAGASEPGR